MSKNIKVVNTNKQSLTQFSDTRKLTKYLKDEYGYNPLKNSGGSHIKYISSSGYPPVELVNQSKQSIGVLRSIFQLILGYKSPR